MIARRVVVSGLVQGVGFRYGVARAATAQGVAGWVRNRRDGTVEALLQGDAQAVGRVIDWCRRGPSQAQVLAVDVADETPAPGLADFGLRPTL